MSEKYKTLEMKVPKRVLSKFKTLCQITEQEINDKLVNLMKSEVYSAEVDNF